MVLGCSFVVSGRYSRSLTQGTVLGILAAHQVVNLGVCKPVPGRLDPALEDSPLDQSRGHDQKLLHFRVRELRVSLDFVSSLFAV